MVWVGTVLGETLVFGNANRLHEYMEHIGWELDEYYERRPELNVRGYSQGNWNGACYARFQCLPVMGDQQ